MKTQLLMIGLSIIAVSTEVEAAPSTVNCMLNKSNTLEIAIGTGRLGTDEVTIAEKNFMEREATPIATLTRPQVIRYGNVIMITQNSGRSGYAFLRFEKGDNGEISGWIDINLFLNPSASAATHGHMMEVFCRGDW
jgi:hypothetical protein